MSVVVIGSTGQLGGALHAHYRTRGLDVIGTSRRRDAPNFLDLAVPELTSPVLDNQIGAGNLVFLMAGMSKLKDCFDRPTVAEFINVTRTVELAKHYAERGCHIVFPSSNRVFNGAKPYAKPDDLHEPRTVYGKLKSATERALLKLPSVTILRLAPVMTPESPLVAGWIDDLRIGKPVHPYRNAFACPVSLDLAVRALTALGDGKHRGVFQLSADKAFGYDGLAFTIATRLGADARLVRPLRGTTDEHYPVNTTLDVTSLTGTIGVKAPGPYDFLGLKLPAMRKKTA